MTGKVISRHMLICDGCGATFGEAGQYPTATDSRRAAAATGWRVVPKIRASGKPAKVSDDLGRIANACDVCPRCKSTFEAPRMDRPSGATWWTEELARLRVENEDLRRQKREPPAPAPAPVVQPEVQELVPWFPDAARLLGGIGRSTTYGLIKSGELRSVTIRRRRFIERAEIDAYIARRRQGGLL